MGKYKALEFAEKVREYLEVESDQEAAEIADEIINCLMIEITGYAEHGGWYEELAETMGWEDDESMEV